MTVSEPFSPFCSPVVEAAMFYPYSNRPVGTTEQVPPPSPPDHTYWNLAISTVGILMASIFLLSSCVFIIKCCLNRHHPSRYQIRRRTTSVGHALTSLYLSSVATRGLDQSTRQAIPTLKFRRGEQRDPPRECAVCLNEFEEEESVRMLPNCFHLFHVGCIDAWLQTHANCPLCRAEITSAVAMPLAEHHVAIDVRDEENNQTPRSDEGTIADTTATGATDACAGKLLHKVLSFGDECIDLRGKDRDFVVRPVRRSFSVGSSSDRQLYRAVQEILRQNPHFREVSRGEGTSAASNSLNIRRSFFSLNGHCCNSTD